MATHDPPSNNSVAARESEALHPSTLAPMEMASPAAYKGNTAVVAQPSAASQALQWLSLFLATVALVLAAVALGIAVHDRHHFNNRIDGLESQSSSLSARVTTTENAAASSSLILPVASASSSSAASKVAATTKAGAATVPSGSVSKVASASSPVVGQIMSLGTSGAVRSGAGLSMYLKNSQFDVTHDSSQHLWSLSLWGGAVMVVASSNGIVMGTVDTSATTTITWTTLATPAGLEGSLSPDGLVALSNTTFVLMQHTQVAAGKYDPTTGTITMGSFAAHPQEQVTQTDTVITPMGDKGFAMSFFNTTYGNVSDYNTYVGTTMFAVTGSVDWSSLTVTLGAVQQWSPQDQSYHAVQSFNSTHVVYVTESGYDGPLAMRVASVDWSVAGGSLTFLANLTTVPGATAVDNFIYTELLNANTIVLSYYDANNGDAVRVSAVQVTSPSQFNLLATAIPFTGEAGTNYRYMAMTQLAENTVVLSFDDNAANSAAVVIVELQASDVFASSDASLGQAPGAAYTLTRTTPILHVGDSTIEKVWVSLNSLDANRFAVVYTTCTSASSCQANVALADFAQAPLGFVAPTNDASNVQLLLSGVIGITSTEATTALSTSSGSSVVAGALYFTNSNGDLVQGPLLSSLPATALHAHGQEPMMQFQTADGWIVTQPVGVGVSSTQILFSTTPYIYV